MAEVQLIIMGRTRAGKPFRPSDWAERLCSQTATFCNKSKLTYSPYIKPVLAEGVRSVLVNGKFEDVDPKGWQFVLHFARDNDLEVRTEAAIEEAPPLELSEEEPDLPWPVPVEEVAYGALLASIYAERDSLKSPG
jgi:hypothetical protein